MMTDQNESWLTRVLTEHPDILGAARELAGTSAPGQDTSLAVRRMLDTAIRDTVRWPRDQDYAAVARDLDHAGHPHLAAVIREAAGEDLLSEARARWEWRYAARPDAAREAVLDDVFREDRFTFSDDGALRGIDGAWYVPGYISDGPGEGFAVAVMGRGLRELVTGFGGYEDQRRWVADRGPTGTGELYLPALTPAPRVVLEEQVLASLTANTWTFDGTVTFLPPDTFTADARYEIFAVMLALAGGGRPWHGWQVPGVLAGRVPWLPDGAVRDLGGEGAPWLQAYFRRLSQTPVSVADGDAAGRAILREDGHDPAAPGWYDQMTERRERLRRPAPREMPDLERWARHRTQITTDARALVQPPHASPGQEGAAPRL
jgi:hypothetical protein